MKGPIQGPMDTACTIFIGDSVVQSVSRSIIILPRQGLATSVEFLRAWERIGQNLAVLR